MKNFNEFVEAIRKEVGRLFHGRVIFETKSVLRNNGVRNMAITIMGNGSAPVVYLEPYFELHGEGTGMEKLAEEIYDIFNTFDELDFPKGALGDFEKMKDKVFYKLVNYEKNRELLKDVPHVKYLDLAVTFNILVKRDEKNQMTGLIHKEHMGHFKTDLETLYRLAKENTPKLMPGRIESMAEVLNQIAKENMGCEYKEGFMEEILEAQKRNPLYILSNSGGVYGAAAMLYENVLKDFAEKLGNDLVILPSSVHEVLLMPYSEDFTAENLKEMVRHINGAEVPEDDVLSDSVYQYKRESGHILIME